MSKSRDHDEMLYGLYINSTDYELLHYTWSVYDDFLPDYQDYKKICNEFIHNPIFISTAESGQLCYTNRCGVVVIGVVIVVGGVVNFLNFDLTIGCLPLI